VGCDCASCSSVRQLLVKKQALAWIASCNRGSNGARRLFSTHLDLDGGCYWRRTEARHSSFAITGSELAVGGECKFVDLADEGGEGQVNGAETGWAIDVVRVNGR